MVSWIDPILLNPLPKAPFWSDNCTVKAFLCSQEAEAVNVTLILSPVQNVVAEIELIVMVCPVVTNGRTDIPQMQTVKSPFLIVFI